MEIGNARSVITTNELESDTHHDTHVRAGREKQIARAPRNFKRDGNVVTIDTRKKPCDESRLLYDRKEAARQLSISIRSLDYLIASKTFRTVRLGKKVMIPHSELVRFASANHYGHMASAS